MVNHLKSIAAVVLLAVPAFAHADDARKDEVEALRRRIQAQEEQLLKLRAELDEARAALVQAKFQADAAEHRCKKLQDALEVAQREKTTGRGERKSPAAKDDVRVTGKVTEVGKDGRLVQINAGLDGGLAEGQSLEVFRVGNGRPTYLGTLKLTRVDPTISIGQFKSISGVEHRPAVGDSVTTELGQKQ